MKNLKFATSTIKFAIAFWFIETMVFLFIYGWHIEPIGVEKYFDNIVICIFIYGITRWCLVVHGVVKAMLKTFDA